MNTPDLTEHIGIMNNHLVASFVNFLADSDSFAFAAHFIAQRPIKALVKQPIQLIKRRVTNQFALFESMLPLEELVDNVERLPTSSATSQRARITNNSLYLTTLKLCAVHCHAETSVRFALPKETVIKLSVLSLPDLTRLTELRDLSLRARPNITFKALLEDDDPENSAKYMSMFEGCRT